MSLKRLDHIVYVVKNLDKAINRFERLLGVRPIFGGYHLNQGTKNALVHLGQNKYLELLSIDSANTTIDAPRWMGVDLVDPPKITRWAIKSTSLKEESNILQRYNTQMGQIKGGERKTTNGDLLTWQLSIPLAQPAVELIPFLIDWQDSHHPANNLPKACLLQDLYFTHPTPQSLLPVFESLNLDCFIQRRNAIRITAKILSPNGLVVI